MTAPLRLDLEGKYEILEKIKEGGMGTVYKVRHRFLDEIRVIKVIRSALAPSPELSDRFLREAKTAIRLRHPSLAVLYDFAIADDGNAFIVMEYIAGMTLEDLLRTGGPPPLGLALEIAAQALRAIGFLHRHRFVHRDIAPDNLMLTRGVDGEPLVKLIDLGIAKVLTGDGAATSTGIFLGKPRYASPEHFGVQELDQRSDLYSFGVVLYELLTGQCPVSGHDAASYMAGHLFRPPRDFAESDPSGALPPELRRILLRTLAKSRTERFASAAEIAGELAPLQDRFPVQPGDLEAVLEPSTRRTAPWTMPPPVGSSQVRLDRQFLAAGPTPQPAAGTGAPAGHATLPAVSPAPVAPPLMPMPPASAPPAPAPTPPAPRPNPALDDTLPLTVQESRQAPSAAAKSLARGGSMGAPAAVFPAVQTSPTSPAVAMGSAMPPADASPMPQAAGAETQMVPSGSPGANFASSPSPSAPRPLAARTLAGMVPVSPGDADRELPLATPRPSVRPSSPTAAGSAAWPTSPAPPASAATAAGDWEAQPLHRTAAGPKPAAAGGATAGGGSPSLTLRRPAGSAFTGPEARSSAVTAGRPGGTRSFGLLLVLFVAAALCAGVWWYVRDGPGTATGPVGPATSVASPASGATSLGGDEKAAPASRSEAAGTSAKGAGAVVPRSVLPPRPAAAVGPGPTLRRGRLPGEAGAGGPGSGDAEPAAVTPGPAGSGARPGGGPPAGPAASRTRSDRESGAYPTSTGSQPRRHPTVPPLEPGVEAPEPADVPDAVYPEAARGSGLAPTVRLAVLVDEKGNVAEVRVLEGDTSHLGFNEAAVTAVRRARFVAATKDGAPVRAWSELAVDFVSPSAHP